MKNNHFLLILENHIHYLLLILTILFLLTAGPHIGWAAGQNKATVYIAHVASFKSAVNAEKYSKLLENKGMKSWTNKVTVPGKGEFDRVYVGFFDSRKAAVIAMQGLKRDGVIPYFAIEQQETPPQGKGETLPKAAEKKLPPKSEAVEKSSKVKSKAEPQSQEKLSAKAERTDKDIETASKPVKEEPNVLRGRGEAQASLPGKDLKKGTAEPDTAAFDPGVDASFYYNQGIKYLVKEQFDQALLSFSNAIRINSKYTEGYIKRGDAWYLKGDYEMAVNDYNTAIALKPDYSESYLGRGLAYKNLGQIKKSEEDLRHACQLGSEEACTLLNVWPKSSPPSR